MKTILNLNMQRNNLFLFDRPPAMMIEYQCIHKRITRVLPAPFYPSAIPPAFVSPDDMWMPPLCYATHPPVGPQYSPFHPTHEPPWYPNHPRYQQDVMYCTALSETVRTVKKRERKPITITAPPEMQEIKAAESLHDKNLSEFKPNLHNKEISIVEQLEKTPIQEKGGGEESTDINKNKQKRRKSQNSSREGKSKDVNKQKRKSRRRSTFRKRINSSKGNTPCRNSTSRKRANRKSRKTSPSCKTTNNPKENMPLSNRISRKTNKIQVGEKQLKKKIDKVTSCSSNVKENKCSWKSQKSDHRNENHEKPTKNQMSSDNNKNDDSSKSSRPSGLKRSAESRGSNGELNKALKCTPSQIKTKVAKSDQEIKKPSAKSSTESIKSTSSESSSSVSEATSSSSSNTNKRTYISFNTGRSNSSEYRSSPSSDSSSTPHEKKRSQSLSSPSLQSSNASVFITPDGTPSALDTSDRTHRSRAKRSLNDQYRDDHYSLNSSLNSSAYYTPESSPGEYGSLKRFKSRWSNRSSQSDYGSGLTSDNSAGVIQPELIGYQMVGDSQFCRFGQQLLGLQRVQMPNSAGRIGICVSGQTITDLHRRVKEKFYPISDKIILMIGTNDFLRNVDVGTMCDELKSLVRTLQENVSNIVLLTLPPIPKLCKYNSRHFQLLDRYNEFIRSLEDGEKVRIADVSPLYISSPPYQKCRMELFELFFSGPNRRHDMIHLNRKGLEVIQKYSLILLWSVGVLIYEDEHKQIETVEKEVRDYALKIGINPDTEKHLLTIALDGLMSPLPDDWKPCLDERINRIYYYNVKTQETQWQHPLDKHFENIVKKKRQEESISAGDDDSKTSIKEDLKSFEEAVTTSDMLPSRNALDSHKSLLSSASQMGSKELSPDGRKVLNPIGRPPLPPKRRAGSSSPKRGGSNLSLRLSPSPSRIDIDSLAIGLPSPEVKSDKQPPAPISRTPAIKLTGGGSEFLKSNQKQTSSPSEEYKPVEEPMFGIVREAESLDLPDDAKNADDNKLKHSISLGESGFDRLTKSKRFASLQESLLSLKSEMDLSNNEVKSSSNATALRGILRDKPSPTTRLWDVDPVLLTSEEKEKLRQQEMKDERKQNVRFADIVNKPISFSKSDLKDFSKSDSDDDSNTNDSSNDLDDFILEQTVSEDDLKRDSKVPDLSPKIENRADLNENIKVEATKGSRNDGSLSNRKEKTNKNILSRLSDLSVDSEKKDTKTDRVRRLIENDNNNSEESENWFNDSQDIINQNENKIKSPRKQMFYETKVDWDLENNSLEAGLEMAQNFKDTSKSKRLVSPSRLTAQYMEVMEKERYGSNNSGGIVKSKSLDLKGFDQEDALDNTSMKKTGGFRKSKLMPDMDIQKVFASLRDNIINSSEQSSADGEGEGESHSEPEVEAMQTSPLAEEAARPTPQELHRLEEQQHRRLREKKAALHQEYEENMEQIKTELQRQESIERQRYYMEVQQSVARYKEELETEKNEREALLRSQCEDYLKELEIMLNKEKDTRIKKMKEDHEFYLKEQEKMINEEKSQFEEETKIRIKTSSSQLEKIVADLKQREEYEITKLTEESNRKINEIRERIERDQAEQEKNYKQELVIVQAEYERVVSEKREELERVKGEQEGELAAVREQQAEALARLRDQSQLEEEIIKKKHAEKMETLNAQLSRSSDREDITQINREFEKVRCEKRLMEEKYKSLKDKYLRLKNEVRLSLERKRQAKLNRQLQQRDPASTAEDSTERSTDHGKPPLARRKLTATVSSDEGTGDNANGTAKTTIKRRPKTAPSGSATTSSLTAESSHTNAPHVKPKNVWNPSPQLRREGVSSTEDHTSVSEEIQLEQDEKWTQSALSPLENLRKQLEKLDDLEEKFPTSVHTDTYLRYPFSGPASASCELEFYRHRLLLERESVHRAKQALAEQRSHIEVRQAQLRHKQHSETMQQLHHEEKDLTDMEVNLHRTRALLGEKIIRLRYLEQSIDRAAANTFTPHSSHDTATALTNTDSSGFSGSDLDLSHVGLGVGVGGRSEGVWTDSVLQSLENINSEIREIWTILGKKQVPGLGPPPMLSYESRPVNQDLYSLAPNRATDIAERTRRLKEWLIRTRDQQTHMIAPVLL